MLGTIDITPVAMCTLLVNRFVEKVPREPQKLGLLALRIREQPMCGQSCFGTMWRCESASVSSGYLGKVL